MLKLLVWCHQCAFYYSQILFYSLVICLRMFYRSDIYIDYYSDYYSRFSLGCAFKAGFKCFSDAGDGDFLFNLCLTFLLLLLFGFFCCARWYAVVICVVLSYNFCYFYAFSFYYYCLRRSA